MDVADVLMEWERVPEPESELSLLGKLLTLDVSRDNPRPLFTSFSLPSKLSELLQLEAEWLRVVALDCLLSLSSFVASMATAASIPSFATQ